MNLDRKTLENALTLICMSVGFTTLIIWFVS